MPTGLTHHWQQQQKCKTRSPKSEGRTASFRWPNIEQGCLRKEPAGTPQDRRQHDQPDSRRKQRSLVLYQVEISIAI